MPCSLVVFTGVPDGSRLEYQCEGDSNTFDAVAQYRCRAEDHDETWDHAEISEPAVKKKTLAAECRAFAVDAVVRILSGANTEVTVNARIIRPDGAVDALTVCVVKGANGTIEFPSLLIRMRKS